MDALDREILSQLQADGRISLTDLAANVGLTLSPCHRRVRDLETSGAISGYHATISPSAIGLNFEAVVFITIGRTDAQTIADFEAAILQLPEVVQVERFFGEPDYMLRVMTKDLESYQELYDQKLGALPGVQRATSTLVMKKLRAGGSLPL